MGSSTQKTQVKLANPIRYASNFIAGNAAPEWYRGVGGALTDPNEVYQAGPSPSQYVGISPERAQGLGFLTSAAQTPGQVPGDVLGEYGRTVRGEYLRPESNPWLSDVIGQIQEDILPDVTGRYAAAGRYGSGAMANAVTDTMGDIAARAWLENYGDERQRMLQAQSLAPQMQALEFADPITRAGMLETAGRQYEADERAQQMEELRQWEEPYRNLAAYQGLISGNPLMGASEVRQKTPFDWGSLLATGLGAAGGFMLGGPVGAGLGSSLGSMATGGPAAGPTIVNPATGSIWDIA